jgi:hypothetical protein
VISALPVNNLISLRRNDYSCVGANPSGEVMKIRAAWHNKLENTNVTEETRETLRFETVQSGSRSCFLKEKNDKS